MPVASASCSMRVWSKPWSAKTRAAPSNRSAMPSGTARMDSPFFEMPCLESSSRLTTNCNHDDDGTGRLGVLLVGRADGEDFDLEAAAGRLVGHPLAGGVAEERLPEGGAGGDHVVAPALLLDGADEVGRRLVVALHTELDD